MISEALNLANLELEQIECLAIGLGPGSYTGIRSAIALAQGWQFASGRREIKFLGLNSAEAIAAQAQADGLSGRVAVIIDAQRGEFYLATYEISSNHFVETSPLRLATLSEVQARHQSADLLIGPEVTKWFPDSRLIFPRAATLAQLALSRTNFLPAEKLEPIYLRETKFVKAPPPRFPF